MEGGDTSTKQRKSRRGKRGGESKRQKEGEISAAAAGDQPQDTAAMEEESEYVAPPMTSGNSLFYIDRGNSAESVEDQMEKISPASYGLVNPDLQKYLKICEDMLDEQKFETPEDREVFVNNVYSEMKNHELQLTTDHEVSRILEKLFWISSDYQIKRFFALTREDTIRLVIHRFSSHAIQTLLLITTIALEREMRGENNDFVNTMNDDEDDGSAPVRTELPSFEELILELTRTLASQWSFLMANEYASHILRVLLLVLAGRPIEDQSNPKNSIKSKRSAKYMEDRNGTPARHRLLTVQRAVPESFEPALKELLLKAGDSMSDTIARGFTNTTVGSTVLQLMLEFQAEYTDLEYPGSLLDKCLMGLVTTEDGASDPSVRRNNYMGMMIEDISGSHFLQVVLKLGSAKLVQRFYDWYVREKLKQLAFHPIANFVVQSVFANSKSKKQLKAMIETTSPMVGDLLFKNRPGVVRSLVFACVELQACGFEIINALYNGLGVKSPEERQELINLLAFLIPYSEFTKADYNRLPFKIQGSLIIQDILKLPGDGLEPLMESYFAQDSERVYSWCSDPSGSRIIEAIINSPQVPMLSKRKMLNQYSGRYAELSMDKYGSHIVDSCWQVADIVFRETIVQELAKREAQLQDSQFGRIILRNCKIEQYKRRPGEWRERERGLERKKQMFKDIVPATNKQTNGGSHSRPKVSQSVCVCVCLPSCQFLILFR